MIEWWIPFLLTTPYGQLPFNEAAATDDVFYLLDKDKCAMGPGPLRVQTDDVPQGHGSILSRELKKGYTIQLAIEFWETREKAACDTLAREMFDLLMAHIDALVNPAEAALNTGQARLQWTPTGYTDDRLVDKIQVLEWPSITYDQGVPCVQFQLHSPYPYAIDLTQSDDEIASLPSSTTLTNLGNTEFWPVFKVHGPFAGDSFVITNETTNLYFVYDIALPGATVIASGHYAEIDTFRNTMYLDGNSANLKPGLDVLQSDFFSLIPGANQLTFDGPGGSCEILWNHAWVS